MEQYNKFVIMANGDVLIGKVTYHRQLLPHDVPRTHPIFTECAYENGLLTRGGGMFNIVTNEDGLNDIRFFGSSHQFGSFDSDLLAESIAKGNIYGAYGVIDRSGDFVNAIIERAYDEATIVPLPKRDKAQMTGEDGIDA